MQVLEHMDFLGITEHMPLTLIALQAVLGLQAFPLKAAVLFPSQVFWTDRVDRNTALAIEL